MLGDVPTDAAQAAGPALDGENGTAEAEGRARARKGERIQTGAKREEQYISL